MDRRIDWLSVGAARRLAQSLGHPDAEIVLTRLTGGVDADTFAFTVEDRPLVLKRFRDDASRARTEFENLSTVARLRVPTPAPLALDVEGVWFGSPALVMTALPGRPLLEPHDLGQWVHSCATVLAEVHRLDAMTMRARTPMWARWQPPVLPNDQVLESLKALRRIALKRPVVFSHDDFSPLNVLFDAGELVGVVDWTDVTVEPREAAVALFRHMLAVIGFPDAAPQFVASYEDAARVTLEHLPLWDILYGLRGLEKVDQWARAFEGLGRQITAEEIRTRSLRWIERAQQVGGRR